MASELTGTFATFGELKELVEYFADKVRDETPVHLGQKGDLHVLRVTSGELVKDAGE